MKYKVLPLFSACLIEWGRGHLVEHRSAFGEDSDELGQKGEHDDVEEAHLAFGRVDSVRRRERGVELKTMADMNVHDTAPE
jgi:hypothetical protein